MKCTIAAMLLVATSIYAGESSAQCPEDAAAIILPADPSESPATNIEIPCPAYVWAFKEEPAGWVKVRSYDNGKEGYAKSALVTPGKPAGYSPRSSVYPTGKMEVLFSGGMDSVALERNRLWDQQAAEANAKAQAEALDFAKKLAIAEAGKPVINVQTPPPQIVVVPSQPAPQRIPAQAPPVNCTSYRDMVGFVHTTCR